jgi:hypothetical protein
VKRLLIVLVACTVLSLGIGVGTASADLLSAPAAGAAPNLLPPSPPGDGGPAGQSASFGDQSNTQKNEANPVVVNTGPVNASPTVQSTVWGNNTSKTEQNGSGNTSVGIGQSNKNANEQSNTQTQSQGSGGCCESKSNCCSTKSDGVDHGSGQSADFGNQSNYQKNKANPVVTNVGPVNASPTVQTTVWGNNTSKTEQNGSGNTSVGIGQSNKNENEQTNSQNQSQGSGHCCGSNGSQSADFGNQENKQKNYANPIVTNTGPVNISPTAQTTVFGNNKSETEQNHSGNTNVGIGQSNKNENEQTNTQSQSQGSGGGCCGSGPEQSVWFGDQSNTQRNDANPTVTNRGPVNISPTSQTSTGSLCGLCGGNNTSETEQNHSGNTDVGIGQSNSNENEQTNTQRQSVEGGGECCQPRCETDCQPRCETDCQPRCETDCQPRCETDCQPKCETDCQPKCETGCEPKPCEPKPRCEPKPCEENDCKPKRCEPKQCEPRCNENPCTTRNGSDSLRS